MANVMTLDLRANTERARDDVRNTLTQAAQAARDFRQEMYLLRDAQIRAREAVSASREAFHNTQADIIKARDALKSYQVELNNATKNNEKLAAQEAKLRKQVADAQKAYDTAKSKVAFGMYAGASSPEARQALVNLQALQTQLSGVEKQHRSAAGQVGYYRRQISQTNQDLSKFQSILQQQGITLRQTTDASAKLATSKSVLSNKIAENRDKMSELSQTLKGHEKALRDDNAAIKELTDSGMAGALIGAALLDRAFRLMWTTLKDVIVESTIYAGRTIELQVALENVGRVNGYTVGQLRAAESAIRQLGITTQDARETLIKFANIGLDLKAAPQLARVAQDLAVVAGIDTSEEIERLTNGIATLQTRALRTAGVYVSLQTAIQNTAKATGRSTESFTEQEKQVMLLNEVLDFGARATGTYEQAMSTASKQMRTMNRLFAEMQNAVGTLFQGPFGLAIDAISTFLRIVAAAPGAFVIFVGAITFFVGRVAMATLANAEWANSFRMVAASILDATRATLGLSTAQQRLVATTTSSSAANTAAAGRGRFITGITGAAAVAPAATSSMLGLAEGTTAAGAVGGAGALGGLSATGVGALVVAVGALTYAVVKYNIEAEKTSFANQENIRQIQRSIEVNEKDAASFRVRAAAIRNTGREMLMSSEEHSDATRLQSMALMRLDPVQRNAIKNDENRAAALDKLADALDRVNVRNREQLNRANQLTIRSFGIADRNIAALNQQTDTAHARNAAYNASSPTAFANEWLNAGLGLIGLGEGGYGGDTGRQKEQELIAKSQGAMQERANAMQGLAEQVYVLQQKTQASDAAIIQQNFHVQQGTPLFEELTAAVAKYRREQDAQNGVVKTAQDLYDQITRNVQNMRLAQADVSITTAGFKRNVDNLNASLQGALQLGYDWQTGVAMMRSGIKTVDDAIAESATSQADYYAKFRALPVTIQSAIYTLNSTAGKTFERVGDAAGKAAKKLVDTRNTVRDLVREVNDLREGQGELGQLAALETFVKRELDLRRQLADTNIQIYGEPGGQQPASAEELEQRLRYNQAIVAAIEAGREQLFNLDRLSAEGMKIQVVYQTTLNQLRDEGLRTQERQMDSSIAFYKIQQSRIEQEQQLLSEITAQYRARSEANRAENEALGLGDTRIAYLGLVRDRQKSIEDAEMRIARLQAGIILRNEEVQRAGSGLLGDFAYNRTFDTPELQRRDVAVSPDIRTPQQKALDQITEYTYATAQNTATIAERLPGGGGVGATGVAGSVIDAIRTGIFGQESGNNYGAVNPHSGALGFAQVMPNNVAPWTTAALGRALSTQEFLRNPQAQIATVNHKLQEYMKTALAASNGNEDEAIRRVAAMWYGGEGNIGSFANTAPQMYKGHRYPSFNEYTSSVLARARAAQGVPTPPSQASAEQPLTVDAAESARRAQESAGIVRPMRPPTPTEQSVKVARGDARDVEEEIVSIVSNLINFTDKLNLNTQTYVGLLRSDLHDAIAAGASDFETSLAIFNSIGDRYNQIRATYVELMKQRAIDNSGFQQSEEHRLEIYMNVELARRKAADETRDKILSTQREIEEANIGSADRIRLAYEESNKAIARSSEDALTSIAQNLPKLDHARELSMDEVDASVVDWLARQKSVSQVYADSVTNLMDNTFGAIDNLLGRLSKRSGIFGQFISDLFGGLLKSTLSGVFQQIYENARGGGSAIQRARDIAAGRVGDEAVNNNPAYNAVHDPIAEFLTGGKTIARMEIQSAGQVIINATGGTGAGAAANVAGSIASSAGLPSVVTQAISSGIIPSVTSGAQGGVFSIGSNGVVTNQSGAPVGVVPTAGTPPFSGSLFGNMNVALPTSSAAQRGGILEAAIGTALGGGSSSSPQQASRVGPGGLFSNVLSSFKGFFGQNLGGGKFGGIFGTAKTGGTFGFGNSGFAQMLPFLGAQFGGMLGGSSRLGSILGTAGGALAGIGLMGVPTALAAGGSLAGSLGFLAPLFSNPITAVVGGALLVGAVLLGRNSRRRQEEKQRTEILTDAKSQLSKILSDVQHDRTDGQSALAQAQQIRQQYLDSVSQLKDKKTRNIAVATVRELDYLINQIRIASQAQSRRQELDEKLIPEFASGGYVGGVDRGYDSVPAMLRPKELVLTENHQRAVQALAGDDVFRRAGVPNVAKGGGRTVAHFDTGGYTTPVTITTPASVSRGSDAPVNVYVVPTRKFAEEMVKVAGGTIVELVDNDMRLDGILSGRVKKTARK